MPSIRVRFTKEEKALRKYLQANFHDPNPKISVRQANWERGSKSDIVAPPPVVRGLARMERVGLFDQEQLRYSRAEVESARVDANRQFFDKFEEIVEKDAKWAYRFMSGHRRRRLASPPLVPSGR